MLTDATNLILVVVVLISLVQGEGDIKDPECSFLGSKRLEFVRDPVFSQDRWDGPILVDWSDSFKDPECAERFKVEWTHIGTRGRYGHATLPEDSRSFSNDSPEPGEIYFVQVLGKEGRYWRFTDVIRFRSLQEPPERE